MRLPLPSQKRTRSIAPLIAIPCIAALAGCDLTGLLSDPPPSPGRTQFSVNGSTALTWTLRDSLLVGCPRAQHPVFARPDVAGDAKTVAGVVCGGALAQGPRADAVYLVDTSGALAMVSASGAVRVLQSHADPATAISSFDGRWVATLVGAGKDSIVVLDSSGVVHASRRLPAGTVLVGLAPTGDTILDAGGGLARRALADGAYRQVAAFRTSMVEWTDVALRYVYDSAHVVVHATENGASTRFPVVANIDHWTAPVPRDVAIGLTFGSCNASDCGLRYHMIAFSATTQADLAVYLDPVYTIRPSHDGRRVATVNGSYVYLNDVP